jgi:hypothetical protein
VLSSVLFLLLLGEPTAAPASGGTAGPAAHIGESRTIVGEIVWVDVPARLVLIRESVKTTRVKDQPPARKTVAVGVAPEVAITRGRTTIGLENLKAKDHVTARYVTTAEGPKALTFRVADASPDAPAGASATGGGSSHAGDN